MVSDTRKFSQLGDIVLLGDFNARTGHNADFIYDDSDAEYATYDSQYLPDTNCIIRNSEDTVVCSRGKDLLDLCIQSRLRIANGRTLGDMCGRFTAHYSLGSSLIDHCIASDDILSKIISMKVHGFNRSLSNHCMLSCIFSVNFCKSAPQKESLLPLPN